MLDQILEIVCSCASVMVGVNIAVRWTNSMWTYNDGATSMLFDATCIGAVAFVLAEMSTPYTLSTPIRTRQTSVGYILIAGSRICNDPSIISSSAVDVLSATMNYTARMTFVGVRDTVVIDPDSVLKSSGATIIEVIIISKIILVFSGVYFFCTGVGLIIFEKLHRKTPKRNFVLMHAFALLPTAGIVVLWALYKGVNTIPQIGIFADLFDISTVNGIGPSAAQVVLGNEFYNFLGYFDSGCFLLTILLMIVYAFMDPILVFPLSANAYACFALTLHFGMHDEWYLFSVTYCSALIFFIISTATFARNILQTHIYDLLFRVAVGCSVLSIAYLFLSCNLSWWSLRFGTGSIGDEFENAVKDVHKYLLETVGGIYDLMQKMNPCSVSHDTLVTDDRLLSDAGTINNNNKITTDSMRINRIDARMYTKKDKCLPMNCYDDKDQILSCSFVSNSPACLKAVESDETLGNSSIVRVENANDKFIGKDGDDDMEDSGDASNFVKKCESLVCEITLGVGLAALALSWVPFVGGPASFALKMASAVGHNVFRFGKRLLGLLPRLRRNRTLIRSLVSMVRQLTRAGSSMTQFETRLLLLSLSIFISFTTVLIFATQRMRNPDAVAKNVSNIVTSVLGPVFIMNLICLVIVFFVPVTIREVLDVLPEIISVDLILKEGYYALRMSHILSTMSIGILTSSELLYLIDYDIAWFWKKIRCCRNRRKVKILFPGASTSNKFSRLWERIKFSRLWERIKKIDNRFTATVLFFTIVFAIFIESIIMKRNYVDISYGGDASVTGWVRQFGALDSHMERQSSIHETMEVEFCGLEGQIVFGIAKLLMSAVVDAAKLFLEAFLVILKAGSTVLALLKDLSDVGIRKIDLKLIPSLFGFIGKTIAYGVPGIGIAFTIEALFRTVESGNSPFSYLIGIIVLQCANIIVQIGIGIFLSLIMKIQIPFIQMGIELGHDFYASIFCSLLVIMSCISIYIGQLTEE